jgi:hypothetical protein
LIYILRILIIEKKSFIQKLNKIIRGTIGMTGRLYVARDISNDPQLDVKFHESFHTLSASDVNPCTNWNIGKKISISI